jgi:hypothetical protein
MATDERISSVCEDCGQVDPDPKHLVVDEANLNQPVPSARVASVLEASEKLTSENRAFVVADLMDRTVNRYHFDCHAASASCEVCRSILEAAPEGSRNGAKLTAHVEKLVKES